MSGSQSAWHLSGIPSSAEYTLENNNASPYAATAYEHYALGLRGLKHGLTTSSSRGTKLALEILVTMLVFCFIEVIKGDESGSALYHLKPRHTVSGIIKGIYPTFAADAKILAFVAEFYAYLLSSASSSVVDGPDPSILQKTETVFKTMDETSAPIHGTLFGCVPELFRLILAAVSVSDKLSRTVTVHNTVQGRGR
ncbi:hypothetical protein B0T21DRAFT_379021 [Apiosordaria backusii]|uniref:Uncharacterized protein n=1 Tax=Apiosordaria backusii TaxID=314023 RepID=A0AA39ZPU0_9PEZI|nr:hypothetical protein B0T21DRAFT_379021 [Apiosordaria backusii]